MIIDHHGISEVVCRGCGNLMTAIFEIAFEIAAAWVCEDCGHVTYKMDPLVITEWP